LLWITAEVNGIAASDKCILLYYGHFSSSMQLLSVL